RRIIDECYGRARQILEANRDKLEVIARALLDKESLDAEELERLLAGQPLDADSPTPGALEVQAPPRTVPAPPVVPSLRPKPEAS
ncbi:MAG: ATP-dependent metalloprotease, partial [Armatimonadota bacterium]|nr:ATP-dependent metalloprotease [Armatimonadota bacterium]